MVAPLVGLPFVCVGTSDVVRAAGRLLEALGADLVHVDTVHSAGHAAQIAALEPIGAVDGAAVPFGEHGVFDDPPFAVVRLATVDPDVAWAASGALALTGPGDGAPLPVGSTVAARLLAAGAVAQLLAACREVTLDIDPLGLLGERAAIAGFGRQGTTSVGGNCHLVRAADGWVALNLARADDVALLPALLDGTVDADATWAEVVASVAGRTRAVLDERAALLGFPLGAVPDADDALVDDGPRSPYVIGGAAGPSRAARLRPTTDNAMAAPASRTPLVVDLASLWAGPLAASLLHATGARVIKVESVRRADGARRGPTAFYDLLNHGKECLALDFDDAADRALLRRVVERADVVIEGSRPRALLQLDIDAHEVAAAHGTTWISITGHGRTADAATRVAFGDDAAAAAGLVVGAPPNFVGDAIADPITGIYAACAALAALVGRRGQVIDVALVRAAAYVAAERRAIAASAGRPVGAPYARPAAGSARELGADSARLRVEFGPTSSVRA